MKKIVVYRERETGKIKSYHEWKEAFTLEKICAYNSADNPFRAEIYEYEENSVEDFFIRGYKLSVQDWRERWEDLADDIRSICTRVDDLAYDCKRALEGKE